MVYSEPGGMYLDEFAILEQPVDCAALIGDKASFSVTAYGDDLTYQWEASRDGVNWTASTAAGSQTDTISGITVTEDRIGRWYRCRVTDTNGAALVSSHVMIRRPFDTWEYTYNADGLRVGKTNTETTQYYYNGDKLSRMVVNGENITFGYDANGAPQYVIYGGHRYFYLTNLQGDVTGIVSMDGEIVVAYSYDAWGNPMPATGEMAATLGKDNPLRYRGYVYDDETGLYYVSSRYYDPALGRFINADGYTSTGQGFVGNNMFAYCNNNPVCLADPAGNMAKPNNRDLAGYGGAVAETALTAIITSAICATVNFANYATKEVYEFSSMIRSELLGNRRRLPHVHHIVPVGMFSNRSPEVKNQIIELHTTLNNARINRFIDPINLVLVSSATHASLHTDEYIAHVYNYVMSTDGSRLQIYRALFHLRIEIAASDIYANGY